MEKEIIPSIHFYDQDFVDLYERSWVWIAESWEKAGKGGSEFKYLSYTNQKTFNLYYSCLSSFFLNYSNSVYPPYELIDYFYSRQEPDGAIRCDYNMETGKPVLSGSNPEGVVIPLLAYAEFLFYHKIGNKKRLREIMVNIDRYFDWLIKTFMQQNGLFSVPVSACMTGDIPREKTFYPVDFNAAVAVNALYASYIGDILNDKEMSFRYSKLYFSLKTRIDSMMWDPKTGFYYDLDKNCKRVNLMLLSSYWVMMGEIPNMEKAVSMINYLKDPKYFGSENPFPSVSMKSTLFKEDVQGYTGAVIPFNTYMVVKGLEKYGEYVFARECAIRHLYFILDTLNPEEGKNGDVWEAYLPTKEGIPKPGSLKNYPAKKFLPQVCLISIALMIENIIGLNISLPRKTVDWTVPSLESMGIEKLSLKRNYISIQSNKKIRGWEIRLESEKLYYFTIAILDEKKKKTLPIPSGKCSMLIDKL